MLAQPKIETKTDVSIHALDDLNETFDVIVCMGVYYHLVDPFYAFTQVRHRCHKGTVAAFEGDYAPDWFLTQPNSAYVEIGEPSRCFVPTPTCLKHMLDGAYFKVEHAATHNGVPGHLVHRQFTVCTPFVGVNPLHPTRPPFGLSSYDPRY